VYKDSKREARLNDNHTTTPCFKLGILVQYDDTGSSVSCLTFLLCRLHNFNSLSHSYRQTAISLQYSKCSITVSSDVCITPAVYANTQNKYKNLALFQAFAAVEMRSALFSDITQRRMVVYYRRFGTTYRYRLQESSSPRRMLYPWRWDR
jgi:hypothetical protein